MRDCKILFLGYTTAMRNAQRFLKESPMIVTDHPAMEREINRYLAEGYRIVSTYYYDGMYFILERESRG